MMKLISCGCPLRRPFRNGGMLIVVASVSCIYGLGAPDEFSGDEWCPCAREWRRIGTMCMRAARGRSSMTGMIWILTAVTFRVRGDVLEIIPAQGSEIADPGRIFRR